MVQRSGKTYYVFPDVAHNQAYIGGPKQYETYRQLRLKQKVANEKLEAAEINLAASEMNWDGWDGWGAWGVRDGIRRQNHEGAKRRNCSLFSSYHPGCSR